MCPIYDTPNAYNNLMQDLPTEKERMAKNE